MKTTIAVMLSEPEKERLLQILQNLNLTVDEAAEQFMQWIVDSPTEAEKWLKQKMEVQ